MPQNKDLKKRLLRGVGANGFGQLVTVLIQVITVPLFLNFWGKELYGEWLIITATPMFLSMSDLGFTIAAENEMTMKVAKRDRKGALEVFQSVWLILLTVSIIVVVSIFAFFNLVDTNKFLSISQLSSSESAYIISLVSFYVLLGMQISLLAGGFRCDGNYALGVCCVNYLRLFDYLVVTVAIYLGAYPLTVAICFVVARSIGVLLMYALLKQKSPWISYGFQHQNLATVRNLTKPAVASMGLPLVNAMSNQGMVLIIGSLLTPVDVVVFSTLRTLSRLALQLMRTIRATISPELSTAYAVKDMVLARKLHRRSCQVSLWLSLVAVIGLIFLGDLIIKVWTKNTIEMKFTLFLIMLLTIVFSSFWYTSFAVLTSTNQHHKIVPKYLFVTVFYLCICTVIVPYLGLNFAAICLMFIEITMLVLVLKESLNLLDEKLQLYLKSLFEFNQIFSLAKR